ncbi:MAG: leucine-rich repeat domain-containing protein [Candidatus Poribacteria bacterium]|nr:leucine-rich repeat domain-containing protein [Candidatus Poribacteria bacterium]
MKKVFYICLALLTIMFSSWLNVAAAQNVNIPDANLEAAVRNVLGKRSGTLTQADMERLEFLDGDNRGIISLTGLEHAINLKDLLIWRNEISDISPLTGLKNLTFLAIGENQISDISSLATLKNLTTLYLGGNAISDIKPLMGLTNLTRLGLFYTTISDVMPLAALKNLTWLHLGGNAIRNIKPLAGLRNLTELYFWDNKISNVAPLKGLTNLTRLDLSTNAIKDVSPLSGLKNLTKLRLQWNSISDVKPLATLRNLAILDLRGNQIRSVRSLEGLRNLDTLILGSNPITVNVPLTVTEPMPLNRGQFAVFSRDRDRSIAGKVKIIYQNWQAFINANPVITKPPKESEGQGGFGGLLERVNETLDNFRTEGFGGTLELIAHPGTKLEFGDLVMSEIMWGRHGTPADNLWVEFYAPRKRITLQANRYALLATGKYLDREVIPKTEHYAGWRVIDRARNASARSQVSWRLPGLSSGTVRDQPPVSMRREISYETGNVPNGSLASSWTASNGQINLQPPSHGSPGAQGGTQVLVAAARRPPMYWVAPTPGRLQRLVGEDVETLVPSVEHITSVAVDAGNGKVYFTAQTGDTSGKIYRANLDGSHLETLASLQTGVPLDLAIDATGRKLYWTDSLGRIRRANFNGKAVKNLIQNLNSPEAIDLDVAGGKLYYAEQDGLWRANFNGKNREELVSAVVAPGRMSVVNGKIYWTEKIDAKKGRIKRANLDGTKVEEIISIRSVPFGIAADSVDGKLYWTDSGGRIQRLNLKNSKIQTVVTGLDTPGDFTLGIKPVIAPAAPRHAVAGSTNLETTQLFANYPNPFNPETWIPYQLATDTNVQILIYDPRGTVVRRLELGYQPRGYYTVRHRAAYWDGRNSLGEPVASGIYFYQLQADEVSLMRKMLIIK